MLRRNLVSLAGAALAVRLASANGIGIAHASDREPVDALGRTPLMLAILTRDKRKSQQLLDAVRGSPDRLIVVNAVDRNQLSVLEYAAWRGDNASVSELLKLGATSFHVDNFGVHALLKAVGFGHHATARIILDFEPKVVNLKQGPSLAPSEYAAVSLSDSPLHVAARRGDTPMVTLLLNYGADVHASNVHGDSPLALAVVGAPPVFASLKMPDASKPSLLQKLGLSSIQRQAEVHARSSSWGTLALLMDATPDGIDDALLARARPSVRWAAKLGVVRQIAALRSATGLES
jgi:hypothetical protein